MTIWLLLVYGLNPVPDQPAAQVAEAHHPLAAVDLRQVAAQDLCAHIAEGEPGQDRALLLRGPAEFCIVGLTSGPLKSKFGRGTG